MMPVIIIYLSFITYLSIMYSQHIIYILFSTRNGSMREVSCGKTMPAIIISCYFLFVTYSCICYLVSAAAVCVRHSAAAFGLPLLFISYLLLIYHLGLIYLLCSTYSGSMRDALCTSMMPAIIMFNHLYICYLLFRT